MRLHHAQKLLAARRKQASANYRSCQQYDHLLHSEPAHFQLPARYVEMLNGTPTLGLPPSTTLFLNERQRTTRV